MADAEVPGIGLADAIEQIRAELQAAATRGAGQALAFRTGPVEVELEVAFSKAGEVDAGVRVWVLSFGGKGSVSEQRTQRLKVTLQPVDPTTGEDAEIADVDRF